MSNREDLSPNEQMDEHRKMIREALIEYMEREENFEVRKAAAKEAISEWVDEKRRQASDWTLKGILTALVASAFGGIVYVILTANGWHK